MTRFIIFIFVTLSLILIKYKASGLSCLSGRCKAEEVKCPPGPHVKPTPCVTSDGKRDYCSILIHKDGFRGFRCENNPVYQFQEGCKDLTDQPAYKRACGCHLKDNCNTKAFGETGKVGAEDEDGDANTIKLNANLFFYMLFCVLYLI